MDPLIDLDDAIVRNNARAWRERAGVPVWAVLKSDGYGWGAQRLATALAGLCEGFCVADEDELFQLRRHCTSPAIVLGSVPIDRLAEVLRADALATISTPGELQIAQEVAYSAGRPVRARVGLRPAASWSGQSLAEIAAFAPALADANALVELWSHVTDWHGRARQAADFEKGIEILRSAGVTVVATDFASTFPLAAGAPSCTRVRIGVGLFGATGGPHVAGVRCALRVEAPLMKLDHPSEAMAVGYGSSTRAAGSSIAVARCGYADGLPASLAGNQDILSIGMQYVTTGASRITPSSSSLVLLDSRTDLDRMAQDANCLPHQIVTSFGNAASARAAHSPSR